MSSVMIPSVPNFQSGIRLQRGRSRTTTGHRRTTSTGIKEFDPFRLDTRNECLWKHNDHGDDKRILVKPKAFGILRYLVDHAGCLATQEELLDAIWPNTYVQPEVLKRHIADIREVLGDDPRSPTFIETRPWRGYQFIAAVRTAAIPPAADIPAQSKFMGRDLMGGDQAPDDSGAFRGASETGNPMFTFTALARATGRGVMSRDLIAAEGDSTSVAVVQSDNRTLIDGHRDCEMKKADLREEIDKLIEERRSIDRAIADLERLEASLRDA
jgi:DNA-binding winged helix-turn-helix (wHTH) protein